MADLLHRSLSPQSIELMCRNVSKQYDRQRCEQGLGPTEEILGTKDLLAIGRLQERIISPPKDLGLGDDRYPDVRVIALAKPLASSRVAVIEVR
jgi:hypothetical protein